MSGVVDRITAVLRHELEVAEIAADQRLDGIINPRHVAERVAEALMSWDFLMALLNEHYPEDVFPTLEDREDRDPGPRIVSLIRNLDAARQAAEELMVLREYRDNAGIYVSKSTLAKWWGNS